MERKKGTEFVKFGSGVVEGLGPRRPRGPGDVYHNGTGSISHS